jgi:hypothetical protein
MDESEKEYEPHEKMGDENSLLLQDWSNKEVAPEFDNLRRIVVQFLTFMACLYYFRHWDFVKWWDDLQF